VIIGSALFGEDSYESQIRLLPKQLGIEEVVHFAGFRANIRHEIEGLDLVVHASTTGEPFGQVIIEGMAAAKPIVATDGGGVPEIVDNGKTGILVPMADAKSMASAICRLLEDPDQAKRMGAEGLHRFRDTSPSNKRPARWKLYIRASPDLTVEASTRPRISETS